MNKVVCSSCGRKLIETPNSQKSDMSISQLPLWRLIVALADAERTVGADSTTAFILAREISRRLKSPGEFCNQCEE